MFDLIVPWLFSAAFLSNVRAAPYFQYPESSQDEQPREDWLRLLDAQLSFDGRPSIASIRVPTLIIAGAEDRLAPKSDAEDLARCINRAELRVLPGGHLMNIEAPSEFAASLLNF
jgi:pimeloyl-ACP methyl ester carboxylesterase